MKFADRYLTLTGSPLYPNGREGKIRMSDCFAAVAVAGLIYAAGNQNETVDRHRELYTLLGLAGVAASARVDRFLRCAESNWMLGGHQSLRIDTKPDITTQPLDRVREDSLVTSAQFLRRTYTELMYPERPSFFHAQASGLGLVFSVNGLTSASQPWLVGASALGTGLFLSRLVDISARYRQLGKIANGDWKIVARPPSFPPQATSDGDLSLSSV